MMDTACVTHELDGPKQILTSRVTGQIGLDGMVEIVTSAVQLCTEYGAHGCILDLTGACTCLEHSEIPIFVQRTSKLLGQIPIAGVAPHNHDQSLQAASIAICHGVRAMACLTMIEARLYIAYATQRRSRRLMQLNHLFQIVSTWPDAKLSGLVDAMASLPGPQGPDA